MRVARRDGFRLSEPPEKKHPWAKYYSERGISRPVIADLVRAPEPKTSAEKKAARVTATAQKQTAISAELAAAVAAATAGVPGATSAPFITIMQKEAVAREMRVLTRIRFAKLGLAVVAGLVVLHLAITRVFYRAPTADALEAHAQSLTSTIVPYYSSLLQPLQVDGAVVALNEAVDSRHLRYAAEVTLRLRESLYTPAYSNGTVEYRQLQESLQSARAQELKFKLFEGAQAPEAPELPLLIQMSHRVGEALVVRVPFEARRIGWVWRLGPPVLINRSVNRSLEGDALVRYAGSPYLVYEDAGALADIRQRMRLARTYIIAVAKEVQKRSNVEAVADAALERNSPGADRGDSGAVASGEPLLPAAMPARIDPDALPPGFDPNAPAIVVPGLTRAGFDPNSPAIVEPTPPPLPASTTPPRLAPAADGLTITVPGLIEVRRPNAAGGAADAPRDNPPGKGDR